MLLAMLGTLALATSALAAPVTILDQGGINDVPGQKDLTSLVVDIGTDPLVVGWQWDDTTTSGTNTLDACALFDTDGDGNANAAVCVVAGGSPAVERDTVTYTCESKESDRCSKPNLVATLPATKDLCSVALKPDPFQAGQQDLAALCDIPLNLSIFAGVSPTLINVCSIPSRQPNADPSDCFRAPGGVSFTKVVITDNGGTAVPAQFNLVLDPASPGSNILVAHGASTAITAGTYGVSEQGPAGYSQTLVCSRSLGGPNAILNGNISVGNGQSIFCTATNNDLPPRVSFTKAVVNNSGGIAAPGAFGLILDPTGTGDNIRVGHGGPTTVPAGSYTVTESGPAGYSLLAGSLSCGGALTGTTLTVALGANISCTATNTDNPVDLSITKTNGVTSVAAGTTTTYTIVVSNSGPHTITGARVQDTLPAAIVGATWTFASTNAGVTAAANSGTGNIDTTVTLPPGTSGTFMVTAPVSAAASETLVNTATITPPSGVTDETNPDNNTATDTDTITRTANLVVTKTDGSNTYVPGGPITYTILVTNSGPSTATNVLVSDQIPAVISTSAAQISCTPAASCGVQGLTAGGLLTYTGGAIPVGGSLTITVAGTVSPLAEVGTLTNTASASSPEDLGPKTGSDTSTRDADIDLLVVKDANPVVYTPGGAITYTVTVSNTGLTTATGASVSDTVPASITGVTATCAVIGTGVCGTNASSGNSVSFTGATLPRDDLGTPAVENGIRLTISGTVSPSSGADIVNSATATAPGAQLAEDDAISTLDPAVDLDVLKTDNSPTYIPGGPISYTITVVNQNVANAPNVSIGDTVPAAISGVQWTCAGINGATCGTASGSGNGIALTASVPGSIPNQPKPTITITVTGTVSPSATGQLVNTAIASSGATRDTNPTNNSSTDTDTPAPRVDLAITKTDGSATYTPGAPITYVLTVRNNGLTNVSGAAITDVVPTAITGVTWTCTAAGSALCGTPQGTGNVSIPGASLPVGAGNVLTITVQGTVDPGATGPLVNTAAVATPDGIADQNPTNNTATDTDTPAIAADLKVTKTDGSATYTPGAPITYTITVSNSGPSNAVNATVTDVLPASIAGATWTCVADAGASCGSGSGSINDLVSIPVGKKVVYTLTGTVVSGATGDLVNTATAGPAANFGDVTPADNSATDTDTAAPRADLAITKTVDRTSVTQGTNAVFTIAVTNNGPSDAPGVNVTDVLPAGLTIVSITPSQGTCTTAGVCQLGVIASGRVATVRLEARVNVAALVTNIARVTSAVPDPTPGNNEASVGVTGVPAAVVPPVVIQGNTTARLAITKSGPVRATAGKQITYLIRVTALRSGAKARSVIVRDRLPPGVVLIGQRALGKAGKASKVRIQNGTVSLNLGDMAPGTSRVVQVTVRIGKGVRGRIVNVGTAEALNAAVVRATATTQIRPATAPAPIVTG